MVGLLSPGSSFNHRVLLICTMADRPRRRRRPGLALSRLLLIIRLAQPAVLRTSLAALPPSLLTVPETFARPKTCRLDLLPPSCPSSLAFWGASDAIYSFLMYVIAREDGAEPGGHASSVEGRAPTRSLACLLSVCRHVRPSPPPAVAARRPAASSPAVCMYKPSDRSAYCCWWLVWVSVLQQLSEGGHGAVG